MSESPTWEELCRRLQRSDRQAFERIFRVVRNDLLGYVQSIVHDGPTSHDLVQDVFVSLWNLRETLDPQRPLRAYMFRMARNRAYRHLRDERIHARRQAQFKEEGEQNLSPTLQDDRVDAGMMRDYLRTWLDQLPDRQKEALVLTRFHGLSHREAGAVMGISPRTVNNHIMRALDTIRERLEAFESVVHEHGPGQDIRYGQRS